MFNISASTLLLGVAVFLVLKKIIDSIGRNRIETVAWEAYCLVASKLGEARIKEFLNKKQQLILVRKEKSHISAQDEYARWTKLNRRTDQLKQEVEQLEKEIGLERKQVANWVGWALTFCVTLPMWVLRLGFGRRTLFFLPKGVFPYAIERVLAFPFGTLGGIGVSIWIMALNSVLSSITFALITMLEKPVPPPEEKLEAGKKVN